MRAIYTIHFETEPPEADVRAIHDGLEAFNQGHAPPHAHTPLNVIVRGEGGRVLGGLLGSTFWGWLYVSVLWLDDAVRGQGLGTRLLGLAEDEARRRGCHHAFLDTTSFQARPFYEKCGYRLWGQLDDFPLGHSRYFLQKPLTP